MIESIIKKIFSKIALPSVSILYSLLINWEKIAGDFLFKHSVPYKFFVKRSELFLACDDPNISTEIYFNQEEIKRRIEEEMKISVRIVKPVYNLQKFYYYKKLISQKKVSVPLKFYIPKEKKERIVKLTSKVKDEELRKALKVFFETSAFLESIRRKSS